VSCPPSQRASALGKRGHRIIFFAWPTSVFLVTELAEFDAHILIVLGHVDLANHPETIKRPFPITAKDDAGQPLLQLHIALDGIVLPQTLRTKGESESIVGGHVGTQHASLRLPGAKRRPPSVGELPIFPAERDAFEQPWRAGRVRRLRWRLSRMTGRRRLETHSDHFLLAPMEFEPVGA